MRTITSVSKLNSKCEKCRYKDSCNNKEMVACALAKVPKSNMKCINNKELVQPLENKNISISINIKVNKAINADIKNEILKQINKSFQRTGIIK